MNSLSTNSMAIFGGVDKRAVAEAGNSVKKFEIPSYMFFSA